MKKILLIVVVFAALPCAYMAGPRVKADITYKPVSIPSTMQAIESYVRQSEAAFNDIRPGAEKIISWNDPLRKNVTPYSIVYMHGYSACRQELAPLIDIAAKKLGANVFYTRLKGHLRNPDALMGITAGDWLRDATEAFEIGRRIGEKTIIVGTSSGATLAAWLLTQKDTDDIAAAVMISPNFAPKSIAGKAVLWPWGKQLTELAIGAYRVWTPRNEGEKKYWNYRQPVGAVITLMSLVGYVDTLDLSRIDRPILVIYSPEDRVVDAETIREKYREIGSTKKEIIPFSGSQDAYQHILAGDIISPRTTRPVAAMIVDFLSRQGVK
jgi:esterase/lipase